MCDAKAPDLAQLAHQWVLKRRPLLPEHQWMRYGLPPPTDHIWEGMCIDDRVVVAVVRGRHFKEDTAAVATMVESAEAACAEAGLVLHEATAAASKQVRGAEAATAWGCALDGKQRTARSDPAKHAQVVGVALLALARGMCAG